MLRSSFARGTATAPAEPDAQKPADRAMDVLQYGTAILAIVVVTLLATFR